MRTPHVLTIGTGVLVGIFMITLSPLLHAEAASYTGIPSADFAALESEIQNLQARVSALENRMQTFQSGSSANTNYATPYATPAPAAPGVKGNIVIDQNGGRYLGSSQIFFTGRGFAPYEQILITSGGVLVGSANADSAGGFSANGIPLSFGTRTFQFTGQASGLAAVATVTGVRDLLNPNLQRGVY